MDKRLLKKAEIDLSINVPYQPGVDKPVKNCWHYSTDGNFADTLFHDVKDFKLAMNCIARCSLQMKVIILAFCLMDNHFHFVLYGTQEDCDAFVREFVRRISHCISVRHNERSKMAGIPVGKKEILTESYLKNAICYDFRNPPVNGLRYTYYDYPWSSGPLYFRNGSGWSSPGWARGEAMSKARDWTVRDDDGVDIHKEDLDPDWDIIDGIVFPGCYVAVDLVERLFVSYKSFNYFAGKRSEEDVEKEEGRFLSLSLSDSEMRQHRDEVSRELFGTDKIRSLDVTKRVRLAKELRHRFNTAPKQIARMVCLPYDQLSKAL